MPWMLFLILFPLVMLLLYRYGFLSTRAVSVSVGSTWGLGSWWKGKYRVLTGRMARWFRVPKEGGTLVVEVETLSGQLNLLVQDREGKTIWHGLAPTGARVELTGKTRVSIDAKDFRGSFSVALQKG